MKTDQTVATAKQFVLKALDEFERPLTRYAMRMLGTTSTDSVEGARDAVQHTFLKLVQQDPKKIKGKVGPWLYRVCRNRIIDSMRSSKARSQTEPWPPDDSIVDQRAGPAQLAEEGEILIRLRKLIGQLTGNEREVIELWSHGLSHKEIATVLDKPSGTVRVGLHRAIKSLKSHPEVKHWLERATCQSTGGESAGSASNSIAAFDSPNKSQQTKV